MAYAQLGASLGMINPLAGLAGGIVGMGADMILAGQQKKDQLAQQAKVNEAQFNAAPSPYSGDGFNQLPAGQGSFQPSIAGYSGLRMGGALARFDGGMPFKTYPQSGPTGHVIPGENTGRAIEDARRMGLDITKGTVAGDGHPKNDDKSIPGANVSSGEIYVDDFDFDKMARGAGMTSQGYANRMYPNQQPVGRAMGGPTDPLAGISRASGNSIVTNTRKRTMFDDQLESLQRSMKNGFMPDYQAQAKESMAAEGAGAAPLDMASMLPKSATQMDDAGMPKGFQFPDNSAYDSNEGPPGILPRPDMNASAGVDNPLGGVAKAGGVDAADKSSSGGGDNLEKLNRDAAIAQGIPMVGSLVYNLFSKRDSLPEPRQVQFQSLDLKTGALEATQASGRARATATAIGNDRGNQSEGNRLAIHANNMAQTQVDAATVEGVRNQEATYNNQGANRVGEINTANYNENKRQEALANQQFRMDKMGVVNESLSGMASIAGSYLNNKVDLASDRDLERFRTDYLKYLGGAKGYENMSIANLGGTTA